VTITIHMVAFLKIVGIFAYALAGLFIGLPLLSLYVEGKDRLQKLIYARVWGWTLVIALIAWALWLPLLILIPVTALLNPETYRD
jgi:hypothetical protein